MPGDGCGFETIRAAALELNEDFTEEPPAYVWQNLRAQLAAEGVIRQPETAEAGAGGWPVCWAGRIARRWWPLTPCWAFSLSR